MRELAAQLSCPSGELGVKTAEMMSQTNSNMISCTIDALGLKNNDDVLEIGPGSGCHVVDVIHRASGISYIGVDTSELMVAEALRNNPKLVDSGHASFQLSDGEIISFPDGNFDKVFSVNTIYFWSDPKSYAAEIFRILKRGGLLTLGFATRDFMEKLPFTSYIFTLYRLGEVEELLKAAGFEIQSVDELQEKVTSNSGESVERTFFVLKAGKF